MTTPTVTNDEKLCQVFEMLTDRLSEIEHTLGMLKTNAKQRDDDSAPGERISGAMHCSRPIRITKHYRDIEDNHIVIAELRTPDRLWMLRGSLIASLTDSHSWIAQDLGTEWVKGALLGARLQAASPSHEDGSPSCGLGIAARAGPMLLQQEIVDTMLKRWEPTLLAVGGSGIVFSLAGPDRSLEAVMAVVDRVLKKLGVFQIHLKTPVEIYSETAACTDLACALAHEHTGNIDRVWAGYSQWSKQDIRLRAMPHTGIGYPVNVHTYFNCFSQLNTPSHSSRRGQDGRRFY